MKRVTDVAKYLCSIGSAIIIYLTVIRATEGGRDILLYAVASVFSVALTVALFLISNLAGRVSDLEMALSALADDDYEQEDAPGRECPHCHAYIDADEEVCPYCGNGSEREKDRSTEFFATEDPEYRGTDFSEEEYVSAHGEDTDGSV